MLETGSIIRIEEGNNSKFLVLLKFAHVFVGVRFSKREHLGYALEIETVKENGSSEKQYMDYSSIKFLTQEWFDQEEHCERAEHLESLSVSEEDLAACIDGIDSLDNECIKFGDVDRIETLKSTFQKPSRSQSKSP